MAEVTSSELEKNTTLAQAALQPESAPGDTDASLSAKEIQKNRSPRDVLNELAAESTLKPVDERVFLGSIKKNIVENVGLQPGAEQSARRLNTYIEHGFDGLPDGPQKDAIVTLVVESLNSWTAGKAYLESLPNDNARREAAIELLKNRAFAVKVRERFLEVLNRPSGDDILKAKQERDKAFREWVKKETRLGHALPAGVAAIGSSIAHERNALRPEYNRFQATGGAGGGPGHEYTRLQQLKGDIPNITQERTRVLNEITRLENEVTTILDRMARANAGANLNPFQTRVDRINNELLPEKQGRIEEIDNLIREYSTLDQRKKDLDAKWSKFDEEETKLLEDEPRIDHQKIVTQTDYELGQLTEEDFKNAITNTFKDAAMSHLNAIMPDLLSARNKALDEQIAKEKAKEKEDKEKKHAELTGKILTALKERYRRPGKRQKIDVGRVKRDFDVLTDVKKGGPDAVIRDMLEQYKSPSGTKLTQPEIDEIMGNPELLKEQQKAVAQAVLEKKFQIGEKLSEAEAMEIAESEWGGKDMLRQALEDSVKPSDLVEFRKAGMLKEHEGTRELWEKLFKAAKTGGKIALLVAAIMAGAAALPALGAIAFTIMKDILLPVLDVAGPAAQKVGEIPYVQHLGTEVGKTYQAIGDALPHAQSGATVASASPFDAAAHVDPNVVSATQKANDTFNAGVQNSIDNTVKTITGQNPNGSLTGAGADNTFGPK